MHLQDFWNKSVFSIPTLKSPTITKRSYFEDCKSRFLLINLRCSVIKTLVGCMNNLLPIYVPLSLIPGTCH